MQGKYVTDFFNGGGTPKGGQFPSPVKKYLEVPGVTENRSHTERCSSRGGGTGSIPALWSSV